MSFSLRYLTFHDFIFKLNLYIDLPRNDALYFGSKSDVIESTCRIKRLKHSWTPQFHANYAIYS